jgi:hypothetical protein
MVAPIRIQPVVARSRTAQSRPAQEKSDALAQQTEGTDQVQMQGYQDRSKYREVVGTKFARELTLK